MSEKIIKLTTWAGRHSGRNHCDRIRLEALGLPVRFPVEELPEIEAKLKTLGYRVEVIKE